MRTVFAVSMVMLAACTANPPSHAFSCMRSSECPGGQRCLISEQRCVATGDPVWKTLGASAEPPDDAGALPAADGGGDAGGQVTKPPRAGDSAARDAGVAPPAHGGSGGMSGAAGLSAGAAAPAGGASAPSDAGMPAADGGNDGAVVDAMIAPTSGDGVSQDRALANWPMPSSAAGASTKPSYTVMGATVLDNVTQLIWQREPPATYPGCNSITSFNGQFCTWEESKSYCASADVAAALGGDGWRLPTKIELESLIDETRFPALDTTAFSSARTDSYFWTSSRYVATTDRVWAVYADFGDTAFQDVNRQTNRVRCVR